MPIPDNITRAHILRAIEEVEQSQIPSRHASKKYRMQFNGRSYPPKYIISLANKFANGSELDTLYFNGGRETNNFLTALGFDIENMAAVSVGRAAHMRSHREKPMTKMPYHNERCPDCKKTVENFLRKIYGRVETQYKFNIGTSSEVFATTRYVTDIRRIYECLQDYRGHKLFVKTETLPNCDFFIPDPGFIVEFDESQHFTRAREIALRCYPNGLDINFDRTKWLSLCQQINAKDNTPIFRDEQRAWYDTLRDFLPVMVGLKPTIRLFSKDYVWCHMDPDNPSDVESFEAILKGKNESPSIEIKVDPNPFFARVIIAGEWSGDSKTAKRLLEAVCDKWPAGEKVQFLITCGGFVQFEWPSSLTQRDVGDNKYPPQAALDRLILEAEKCIKAILSEELSIKLSKFTRFVTIGIDSFKEKISTTQNYIGQLHIELVALIDIKSGTIHWIGKSYPTPNQQNGLVRFADLKSHFVEIDSIGKVMILGCHDLTVFNPRSGNAKGWRARVNKDFHGIARAERPEIVFQHPHTTDSVMTWTAAWNGLKRELETVKIYASAGRFYNSKGVRCGLGTILDKTKCGSSIDFIINPSLYSNDAVGHLN